MAPLGFDSKHVVVTGVADDGYALCRDRLGKEDRVNTRIVRVSLPVVEGDRWIIDRSLGTWSFAARVGELPDAPSSAGTEEWYPVQWSGSWSAYPGIASDTKVPFAPWLKEDLKGGQAARVDHYISWDPAAQRFTLVGGLYAVSVSWGFTGAAPPGTGKVYTGYLSDDPFLDLIEPSVQTTPHPATGDGVATLGWVGWTAGGPGHWLSVSGSTNVTGGTMFQAGITVTALWVPPSSRTV